MNSSNLTTLNEQLSHRPEPIREKLAGYIADHLDAIEEEMNQEDSFVMTPELRDELVSREAAARANPNEGVSWETLEERLLKSR